LENSSSTNWIFSLQKSISKLIFAGYRDSKNSVLNRLKTQFAELDFSKLIFQNSSTDQKGVRPFQVLEANDSTNVRQYHFLKSFPFNSFIHYFSRNTVPEIYFVELVDEPFWEEQNAPYTPFLPRPTRKELNVPKLKSS
jgi:hypothetical protein